MRSAKPINNALVPKSSSETRPTLALGLRRDDESSDIGRALLPTRLSPGSQTQPGEPHSHQAPGSVCPARATDANGVELVTLSPFQSDDHVGSTSIQTAASNNLILTDVFSFKRLAELERLSHAGLYQGIHRTLIRTFHTNRALTDIGTSLSGVADHAHILRRFDIVGYVGQVLSSLPFSPRLEGIGHYYLGLGLNRGTHGDTVSACPLFERAADNASLRYRARAMHALGTNALAAGDHKTATSFYREVIGIVARDPAFDPVTLYFTSRISAVIGGMEGDHRGAVANLEKMFSLARMASSVQPYAYYDYMNTLAVELAEVGRLEQARRASEMALASPFAPAYPEWQETFDEITLKQRRASRSTVAVSGFIIEPAERPHRRSEAQTTRRHAGRTHNLFSFPATQPTGNAELEYERPQGSQARVLDFQQWKRRVEPNPAQLSALSAEQRIAMTTGEKLIRLMDLISQDDTDDETIGVILEAVEAIVVGRRGQR